MDIKSLQLFLHVAETRSLSKASTLLSMTQPGLSRQIKKLEAELGVSLLHRDGRGVSLTPAGKVLASHAQKSEARPVGQGGAGTCSSCGGTDHEKNKNTKS